MPGQFLDNIIEMMGQNLLDQISNRFLVGYTHTNKRIRWNQFESHAAVCHTNCTIFSTKYGTLTVTRSHDPASYHLFRYEQENLAK